MKLHNSKLLWNQLPKGAHVSLGCMHTKWSLISPTNTIRYTLRENTIGGIYRELTRDLSKHSTAQFEFVPYRSILIRPTVKWKFKALI